ncbi:hypothetical protein Tco_1184492 [Tanacetum coccineum]
MDLAALFKKGYRTTPLYLMLPELLYLPLEQLEVTLPDEKVLAKVKATRKRKVSTAVGTSAKSSHRKRHARRSYKADSGFGASMIFCACWSGRAPRTAIPDRAPEQLEVTLSGEKVLARVEAPRKRKASTAVGISTESSHQNRPIRSSSRAYSSLRQLSNDGVAKGRNIGGQAMPPPQEIHTGFDPQGSSADDLGNQVADDAPMNGNDYEIDGGNDHSHDGGHPIDVENHEEPEQASSVPNDTSDRIEREIASPAPSPYYLPYPFEEGERSNAAMYLGRSRRSIMIQGLNDDQQMDKVNVLHCQKIIHEGELVARFWGLLRQYEDLRTSNWTTPTSLATDKEKSMCRKKLVRCQEKTIGKLTTKGTRLRKELHDARRAAEKKSDSSVEAQSQLEIMTTDVKDITKKSLAEWESELLGLKDEVAENGRIITGFQTALTSFF